MPHGVKKSAKSCQIFRKENKALLSANSVADISGVFVNVLVKITSNPAAMYFEIV